MVNDGLRYAYLFRKAPFLKGIGDIYILHRIYEEIAKF